MRLLERRHVDCGRKGAVGLIADRFDRIDQLRDRRKQHFGRDGVVVGIERGHEVGAGGREIGKRRGNRRCGPPEPGEEGDEVVGRLRRLDQRREHERHLVDKAANRVEAAHSVSNALWTFSARRCAFAIAPIEGVSRMPATTIAYCILLRLPAGGAVFSSVST